MRAETVKIDEERGVAVITGEKFLLAKEIRPEDKGRWFAFTNMIRAGSRFDVALLNQRDEVVAIWDGYLTQSSLAVQVYPVWVAAGKDFKKTRILLGKLKLRKPWQ